MGEQYILYEHAAGYALFATEIEEFATQIADIVADVDRFKQVCKFVTFQPFKRGREALENINSISEGIIHPHLEDFLISSLPKKKKKFVLGVEDIDLINSIKEKLGIICNYTEDVKEMIRGIRFHFHNLVPGFPDLSAATKVQLGLAHAYSRSKVKFNVGRVDNMIIQTITLVDQMDKDINSLTMRIREWYSHHFPELLKIVPENMLYIQCINAVRDRKNMPEDAAEKLQEILNDPQKVQNVIDLARSSMGMDISESDLENMYYFVERVIALTQRRKDLTEYLKSKMSCVAPNLAALIGDFVGARLIAQAGSLINLAKSPASTVQILGAEKALFRAIKTRGNTPKYGLLFHSKFIGKAAKPDKGRISRYLANKCSVASRIDCFREVPTDIFGNKMKEQVEDRLKFYETGAVPSKNCDIMDKALEEAEISQREILKRMTNDSNKSKKRKYEELKLPTELDETMAACAIEVEADTSVVKKKKKRKLNDETIAGLAEESIADEADTSVTKKKKKKRNDSHELNDQSISGLVEESIADEADTSVTKKKKKKKKRNDSHELNDQSILSLGEGTVADEADISAVNGNQELNGESMAGLMEGTVTDEADTSVTKKKKKKKKKRNDSHELNDQSILSLGESTVADEADISAVNGNQELNGESMAGLMEGTVTDEADTSSVKKKKKKRKLNDESMGEAISQDTVADEADTSIVKKKKKKKQKDIEQEM